MSLHAKTSSARANSLYLYFSQRHRLAPGDLCSSKLGMGRNSNYYFIAVGTGAAPVEFSDHVGMPLREGIAFTRQILEHYNLHKSTKIIAF